jgi:SAM-dependent methyltransferase
MNLIITPMKTDLFHNDDEMLKAVLACPVCHGSIPTHFFKLSEKNKFEHYDSLCPHCGVKFEPAGDEVSFVPINFNLGSDQLQSKHKLWKTLQENGKKAYSIAPEFNLSVPGRKDAEAFGRFCSLTGNVLDVGCGPSTVMPAYAFSQSSMRWIGLDPIEGVRNRTFPFVHGIAECLPFASASFDHVTFASSLDHCLDACVALAEARRILKPTGQLNLWIDGVADELAHYDPQVRRSGAFFEVLRKGFNSLVRHNWIGRIGVLRALKFIFTVAQMKTPQGATDPFHVRGLDESQVRVLLSQVGFGVTKAERRPEFQSAFITAMKSEPLASVRI